MTRENCLALRLSFRLGELMSNTNISDAFASFYKLKLNIYISNAIASCFAEIISFDKQTSVCVMWCNIWAGCHALRHTVTGHSTYIYHRGVW